MSRPKEFNPARAMQEAMEAFWEHGYHGTSVNDLLAEMKLNRGSLYGTFGDKKSLFLAALNEYERQGREKFSRLLERPGAARDVIDEFVRGAAEACTGEQGQRGCLALKAALEMAPHDPDVAAWVRQVTREREMMLARLVRRGQDEGQIDPRLDSRAAARFLLSALTGLRVLGVASASNREIRPVLDLILQVLQTTNARVKKRIRRKAAHAMQHS